MVIKQLFSLRKTNRPWHLPAVAGLCVGIPLLLGLYLDDIEAGKLASVGALVILYIQRQVLTDRLMALMVCSFGFILSYAIGSIFSFGFFLPPLILGLYTFAAHFSLHKLGLDRPPGNFFFIMVASMAIATPKEVSDIAIGVGNLALGVIIACVIGLFYSLLNLPKGNKGEKNTLLQQNPYSNFTESIILGITVGASLLVAKLLHMKNPYWIPISCMAVMQGISTTHVWERALQRVLGTVVGLALTGLVLQLPLTVWHVCLCILILQIIIEFFVVRNYAIAAVFITMLTVFLAEPNIALTQHSTSLIETRMVDTLLGSAIGALGGWMLYHEKLHQVTKLQIRRTRTLVKKAQRRKKNT